MSWQLLSWLPSRNLHEQFKVLTVSFLSSSGWKIKACSPDTAAIILVLSSVRTSSSKLGTPFLYGADFVHSDSLSCCLTQTPPKFVVHPGREQVVYGTAVKMNDPGSHLWVTDERFKKLIRHWNTALRFITLTERNYFIFRHFIFCHIKQVQQHKTQ